jgi:DNA-directed RNA polymerase specialized sigma24 family protein
LDTNRSRTATAGASRGTTADLAGVPDEQLIDQALAGDRDAFGALVLRHERGLVNYIFRLVGSRDLAMDLAQETFMKVFVSLASFDPRYRFTTWLYRIASNGAIDHLRRKQPRTPRSRRPAAMTMRSRRPPFPATIRHRTTCFACVSSKDVSTRRSPSFPSAIGS